MRFLLLFLSLFLQFNASGYNIHIPQENHAIKTLTPENEDFNERSCILFRYYDPSTGNYISQDPIGLEGGNPTMYGYVCDTNSWIDVFGLDCDTKKLRQHAADTQKHINSLPNQNMTQKQLDSIDRSLKRYADTGDAKHLSIAERKKQMYVGQRMDAEFKSRVRADESLSHLKVAGRSGPDVTRADGKWWDLTTQKDWENHQKRYGGGGTGLFWD